MAEQKAKKMHTWDVTMRGNWFKDGKKTFHGIKAASNMDAKAAVIMQEFNHMFTGLMDQMTAKRTDK